MAARVPLPMEQYPDYQRASAAIDMLERYAVGEEPFLLRLDFFGPHYPHYLPEPYASLYEPAQIRPWANFADPLADGHAGAQWLKRRWGVPDWDACAEIAAALRQSWQMCRPDPALQAVAVGRHRKDQLPARIIQPPQQPRGLMAKPPGRGAHADVAAKPGLDPPGARLFQHDDEGGFDAQGLQVREIGAHAPCRASPPGGPVPADVARAAGGGSVERMRPDKKPFRGWAERRRASGPGAAHNARSIIRWGMPAS